MSDLLNSASLVMIPSGYKEDTVYSVVPSDGSGDLQFTRSSNGTRINSAGLVEVTPWNLLQQSETFNNPVWTANSNTVTANTATAPNGTTTADTFTLVAGADASIYQAINGESNNYTTSVYAKYVSGDKYLYFFSQLNSQGAKVWFDIQDGTVSNQVSGFVGTIENVGSGWYKCSMYNTTASVSDYIQFGVSTTNSSRTLSNNSVSYFWGAQVNLGTAKPYFPTTDRLNVPRLTYQNGGGGCPSLLLEKQSTNLITYSEDFTNAIYITGGGGGGSITRTANYAISPDGTQNADRLQIVRGSSYVELYQRVAVTIGTTYTFSFWAKSLSGTPTLYTTWNGAYSNEVTFTTDWVRYTDTFVAADTTAGFNFATWTGLPSTSTTADLLVWGAQLEASSYPTSYIPTTSASATRVADACFKTGVSSLIGQTSGVLFVDFIAKGSYDSNNLLMLISTGSAGEIIYLNLVSGTIEAYIAASSTQQFLYNGGTVLTANTRHKLAIGYANNDIVLYHNGTQLATDTSATIPACSVLRVGDFLGGTLQFGNTINQSILFPSRLSNSELASLTSL